MSDNPRSSTTLPRSVTFGLVGLNVLLVLLIVATVILTRTGSGGAALNRDEQHALEAGKQVVLNVLTYTRSNFEADAQRAVDSTTEGGQLRKEVQNARGATLQSMQSNKFDLLGEIVAAGVSETSDDKVVVLVTANGFSLADPAKGKTDRKKTQVIHQRFQVTMKKVGDKWLADEMKAVGIV